MADTDKKTEAPDVIELVAVERGFAMGKLIEPGVKFKFRAKTADGKTRKLPKWAQPADKPLPAKAAVKNGDLKPADTQRAVAAKTGQLTAGLAGATGEPPLV